MIKKNILAIVLFTLLSSAFGINEEINKYKMDINISPRYYSEVFGHLVEKDFEIAYIDEIESFMLFIENGYRTVAVALTKEQANLLIAAIDKYQEWRDKAILKEVMFEKEITKVYIYDVAIISDNEQMDTKNKPHGVKLLFKSHNEMFHDLVFMFEKFEFDKWYMDFTPEKTYFSYSEALKLRKALTQEYINEFLIKQKKQEAIESEFN